LALALKDERPDLQITGSDLSAKALELAKANGQRLGLEIRWRCADLLDGLGDDFDAVLANLPYVADSERAGLAPEILRHEPPGALFAGADGMSAIRRLLESLAGRRRARMVAVEIGAGQAGAVAELARTSGFPEVRSERDLAGIERIVVAER
jgi:release factor glutamine methyltransferase